MKGKWKYLIFRNFILYIHNCTVMLNSCHDIKIKFSLWNRLSWKLNSAFFFFFKMINQLLVSKYKSFYMHYKKNIPYSKCMIMHATQFIYGMYKYILYILKSDWILHYLLNIHFTVDIHKHYRCELCFLHIVCEFVKEKYVQIFANKYHD